MRLALVVLGLLVFVPAYAQDAVPRSDVDPEPPPADQRPGPISPDLPPTGDDHRPVTALFRSEQAPLEPTQQPEPPLPLAGYRNGSFYLKDPHDYFVLYPKGRL